MLIGWVAVLAAIVYIAALFGVAWFGAAGNLSVHLRLWAGRRYRLRVCYGTGRAGAPASCLAAAPRRIFRLLESWWNDG